MSEGDVAVGAKKRANLTCLVTVINMQAVSTVILYNKRKFCPTARVGTFTFLDFPELLIIFWGYAESSFQSGATTKIAGSFWIIFQPVVSSVSIRVCFCPVIHITRMTQPIRAVSTVRMPACNFSHETSISNISSIY